MIKDYYITFQQYNLLDKKPNGKQGYYYDEKIRVILKNNYDINLSNIHLTFSPLYPDGSLGELDWIYDLFEVKDFKNFKPKKIAVISDKELDDIKIGEETLIEFVSIPHDIFNEVLKKVIRDENKGMNTY
jgi:hypothetical protein